MDQQDPPGGRRPKRRLAEQTAQTLIAALLLGTATGCATVGYDDARARPPIYNARPMARPVTQVQVMPGDTVPIVARRFRISEESIIEANGLREPYRLRPGQSLILPPSSVHIVRGGETVASIARSYGVSMSAVVAANRMSSPDNLRPGQRLTIPFVTSRQVARVERVQSPDDNSAYDPRDAAFDPRVAGARYYASNPRPKPGYYGQGGPEESGPPRTTVVASVDPADAAYSPNAHERAKPAAPDAPIKASSRFIWPVRGQIISSFGRRNSGVHNDGVNIAAEPGAPVKAADHGVVVYAGNELAGYGNLLLIRHSNGFVTAYAHNKRLLVERGETVKQGQTIALVGSTGDVDRPQLHFEIRKGDRAVDPDKYLARANARL